MILVSILAIALYLFVLLSPLVLIDILSGWTFLIYPLYIFTCLGLLGCSEDDYLETEGEPPDGHQSHFGPARGFIMIFMTLQGISALIFFIIFAFNDGAGAFSSFIISSIILSIVIKFRRYFNSILNTYGKLLELMFGFYKKFLRDY